MRLLVTSFPGLGHLHPVAPLARAAAAAGHDVRVAIPPELVEWTRRCGLTAVAAGPSAEQRLAVAAARAADGHDFAAEVFTTASVPALIEELVGLARDWQPDLVLHEEGEYAAPLLARLLGVPCVTQSWSSAARTGRDRAALDEPLRRIWEACGDPGPARQCGDLYLDSCPALFQVADVAHVAPRVVQVRPTAFDGPVQEAPPWLAQLPRPAVHVTLGTVPLFCRPDLLQRLVDAAAAVAPAVVVATGPHAPDAVVAPRAGVHVVKYLQQSLLLPHVDAVVGHGGAGTTLAALLHGLPQLVLPGVARSQQQSAAAVAAAGVGLRLDWEDATPERLASAMTALLEREDLRARACAALSDIDALPGPAEVVALLEAEAAAVRVA